MLASLHLTLRFGSAPLVAAALLALSASPLVSQEDDLRRVSPLPQWELRQDVTLAREPGAHLGVGLNVRAGYYVRLGAALAAGAVKRRDDIWVGAQRVDLTARFLLDPFGERPRAWYGGGGVSLSQQPGERVSAALQLLVGFEGRRRRTVTPAIEIGVGDGVRLGVVLRRTRRGQAR
jgi:hypothetical protein